jgi:hypothetical protein
MGAMDKNIEKLMIEKSSFVMKDLIQQQMSKQDFEFINSKDSIVIAKAVIENGEIIYLE